MPNLIKLTPEDANMLLTRPVIEQHVTLVIKYDNHIDENRFVTSINAVLSNIKHMRSVVTRVKNKLYFQPAEDIALKINLVHSEDTNGEIERFVISSTDPFTSLPVSVLIIRNYCDTICFKLDHIYADGSALKLLYYLLVEHYNTGKINTAINPDRDIKQITKQFSLLNKLKLMLDFTPPRPGILPKIKDITTVDKYVVKRIVQKPDFLKIKQSCKNNGITINDLLLTSFWLSILDVYSIPDNYPYLFMIPFDMRRYITDDKKNIVGNFSSAEFIKFDRKTNESFIDAALRVSILMKKAKDNIPGIRALLMNRLSFLQGIKKIEELYKTAALYKSGFCNLSNVGIIENSKVTFSETKPVDAYICGPIQYPRGLIITAATFNGTLTLTCSSSDKDNFRQYVVKIMDQTIFNILDYK
jgi:NRPS condensation-like uncharacterized protein